MSKQDLEQLIAKWRKNLPKRKRTSLLDFAKFIAKKVRP